jgi:SAM-dependent methyltransferase
MNEGHAKYCSSPEWARHLQEDVLPWLLNGTDLGKDMLEVGPGPGAATDLLRHKVPNLVAVEQEEPAARKLADRFPASNVRVVHGDATNLDFPAGSFDSGGCFTMLHHLPTATLQNCLLAEILRVLRPGGVLIGSDSLASDRLHHFHENDTYLPVEPATLLTRLQTLGYVRITMRVHDRLSFIAHKPGD